MKAQTITIKTKSHTVRPAKRGKTTKTVDPSTRWISHVYVGAERLGDGVETIIAKGDDEGEKTKSHNSRVTAIVASALGEE